MLFDLFGERINNLSIVEHMGNGVRFLRDDDLSSAAAVTRAFLEDKLK